MKCYQLKVTLRNSSPPEWYRILIPSGITFSQLYFTLDQLYGFGAGGYRFWFGRNSNDQAVAGEFTDGKPFEAMTGGDIYDSAGTYVDTLMRPGHTFSLIAADGTDLKIDVEKTGSYTSDAAPGVYKISKALTNRLLREKKTVTVSMLLSDDRLRTAVSKSRFFHTYSELVEMFNRGEMVMIKSSSPRTPEERRSKGSMTILKEFANLLRPLLGGRRAGLQVEEEELRKQAESLEKEHQALEKQTEAWRKVYGIMKEDRPDARQLCSEILTEAGVPEEEIRKHVLIRGNTEELLKIRQKKDLREFARDLFGIDFKESETKDSMAAEIARHLLEPENLKRRIYLLSDEAYEFFCRLTSLEDNEKGITPANKKEEQLLGELEYAGLAWRFRSGEAFVMDDQMLLFCSLWTDEDDRLREEHAWMDKCQTVCANYYGVLPWEILEKVYARKYKNADSGHVRTLFRDLSRSQKWLKEIDGRLVVNGFDEDDYYKYIEKDVQRDKPFYIPSRKEIEEYCEYSCIMSRGSYQAMKRFLMKQGGCSEKKSEQIVAGIYQIISSNDDLQEAIDYVQKKTSLKVDGLDDLKKFVDLYEAMHNDTNLIDNRGWTPNELSAHLRRNGGHSQGRPAGSIAANPVPESLTDLSDFMDFLMSSSPGSGQTAAAPVQMPVQVRNKKIGRNEPCPCGSGKKYKNCCGRS